MFRYETHMHTKPVSKCATATVRESVEFYKRIGYAGIFLTNHFLDGNLNIDRSLPYEDRINFFFSDYEEAVRIGNEIGFSVFCGIEMSYKGTDFLVYGLDKQWFLDHPQIEDMKKSEQLPFLMNAGALVIHAHPCRESGHVDHIRLFPRCVHGVETYNGNRTDFENKMAEVYAENYGLIPFAGSDNHYGPRQVHFGGMETETPIRNEADFVERVKNGKAYPFRWKQEVQP